MNKKASFMLILGLMLLLVVSHAEGDSTANMYVEYPPTGSGTLLSEAMRPGEYPTGASEINSYPSDYSSGYGFVYSYPGNNDYNGTWTNPNYANDTSGGVPNWNTAAVNDIDAPFDAYNSYPSNQASVNVSVTNPTQAYDGNPATAANVTLPSNKDKGYFDVYDFNTTGVYPSLVVDIHMTFSVTVFVENKTTDATWSEFRIIYYVGSGYRSLIDWTGVNLTKAERVWSNVEEPNDGIWSMTDVGNLKVRYETRQAVPGGATADYGWFAEYETWVVCGEVGFSFLDVYNFNATGSYTIYSVDFTMKYEASSLSGCEYRVLYNVSSQIVVLQDWSRFNVAVGDYTWSSQPEPNDGVWTLTDISNTRFRVETKKEKADGFGTFKEYGVQISFTVVGAPGLTNPTYAYDGDMNTATTIDISQSPYDPGLSWYEVIDFNNTVLATSDYHVNVIDVKINYSFVDPGPMWAPPEYQIKLYVGNAYKILEYWTSWPEATPVLKTYYNQTEPNDSIWNATDISNMKIRVETKNNDLMMYMGSGTFNAYEAWVVIPTNRVVFAVSISDVENLYSYQFYLNWSGPMFKIHRVVEGPFLKRGGKTSFMHKDYDSENYTYVTVTLTGAIGVSGNGTLAYIDFEIEGYGSTTLDIYSSGMMDTLGGPIYHTRTSAYFSNKIPGDVNGDAIVDGADFSLMGGAYRAVPGDPNWLREADINQDGIVDGADFSIAGGNYREEWP